MRGILRISSALRRRDSEPGTRGSLVKGVPEGIDLDTLAKFCIEHFGKALTRVSYIHLSGWKKGGAYRLFLQTKDRKERRLVFKDARYDLENIPALDGLPLQPGPPEYELYSQAGGAMAEYLPAVYHASEIVPGKHYRYLLEDLSADYRRAHPSIETLDLASKLPAIHRVLNEWLPSSSCNNCLKYDQEFTLGLQQYAWRNLTRYSQHEVSSLLGKVCRLWNKIAMVHSRAEFHEMVALAPVHGDLNHSNLHINRKDPSMIKLVDWEWMGFGPIHSDLASILKSAGATLEGLALHEFSRQHKDLTLEEHKRLYLWCQMERGMLDAGFLAAIHMDLTMAPGFDIPLFIESALLQILRAYHELA